MSQGIGKPEDRERDLGQLTARAVGTHTHLSIKFAVLYGRDL